MIQRAAIEALRARFVSTFGRNPQGVWAAPGRVNLIGEHTDYNDGFVLPCALDRSTLAAVAWRPDDKARCASVELGAGAEVRLSDISPQRPPEGWSAYPLGVAWALAEIGVEVRGFDLLVTSDIPLGAGLASSAALECSVALALADLAGAVVDASDLALVARRAENDIAGAPTGVMDQLVSMRARAGHALFLDCRSLEWRHVAFDPTVLGLALLVIDTRTRHALVSGGYRQRRQSCEEAARILGVDSLRDATEALVDAAGPRLGDERRRRVRHVLSDNDRVLDTVAILESGAATAAAGIGPRLGALLSASHASLRDCFEVSCPELDAACASAEAAGALGARMTGGGFGGCAIALTPIERVAAVISSVTATADKRGFPTPGAFTIIPSGSGRRVM